MQSPSIYLRRHKAMKSIHFISSRPRILPFHFLTIRLFGSVSSISSPSFLTPPSPPSSSPPRPPPPSASQPDYFPAVSLTVPQSPFASLLSPGWAVGATVRRSGNEGRCGRELESEPACGSSGCWRRGWGWGGARRGRRGFWSRGGLWVEGRGKKAGEGRGGRCGRLGCLWRWWRVQRLIGGRERRR